MWHAPTGTVAGLVVSFSAGKLNDADCTRNFQAVCKRRHVANPYLAAAWKPRAVNDHCYYKLFDKVVGKRITPFVRKSWNDAQTHCRAVAPEPGFPGGLVKIDSSSKNQFVKDLLLTQYRIFENRPVWIGLQKVPNEQGQNEWQWRSDGETVDFHNWMQNEPNNKYTKERCAQMNHAKRASEAGGWNDAQCSMRRGYVCEVCDPNWAALPLVSAGDDTGVGALRRGSSANTGVIVVAVVVIAVALVAVVRKVSHRETYTVELDTTLSPTPSEVDISRHDTVSPIVPAVVVAAGGSGLEWDTGF